LEKITLYGLNKNGGHKLWSIETKDEEIFIEFGQENGKIQLKIESVKGKNIGRSNETTPAQQAELEALSKVAKQKDKGYRENKEELVELPLLPMLASDYLKQGHRIQFPCFGSAKLDGVRCLAICSDEGVVLKSRGGKLYDVKHIIQQLEYVMKVGDIWDGEIYLHGKYLEEIVSAVKKYNPLTINLTFRIFDVVEDDMIFEERLIRLLQIEDILFKNKVVSIDVLPYELLSNERDMHDRHEMYVNCGYEGIMLRNMLGRYESGKRSADLQKLKSFLDSEFKIIDVIADKDGGAIFVVQNTFADNQFNVVGGSHDQRKQWLAEKDSLTGQDITVKYQTLYKDTKLPQFPTFVAFRNYE
jgi:ATP-dependent DNA ligase